MKILVFLQGTVFIENNLLGINQAESVAKSRAWATTGGELGELIPIGNAGEKLAAWEGYGASLFYLTASRKPDNVRKSLQALEAHHFPSGEMLFRREGETYAHVAERLSPDIIVEDDCESIGGRKERVYPNMNQEYREKVKSVVVKEFEGIDHLPSEPSALLKWKVGPNPPPTTGTT